MLSSLGTDIVEIGRIRGALGRRPGLAARLFTEKERAYCERRSDPAPHYAARFAAKEATAKALGRWLRWQEVEVLNDERGRPLLQLTGEAAALAHIAEGGRLLVSLSHGRDYAIAVVALLPAERARPDGNPSSPGVHS
ncbi:MAG: holo-ACP synthase [Armatimonadota bacterium]|jgi:holo-[acyl-carrier protein] synthase